MSAIYGHIQLKFLGYLMKNVSVAFDNSIDCLKHFVICFLINENTVTISWMIEQWHHHLKNSYLFVNSVWHPNFWIAFIHLKLLYFKHLLHAVFCVVFCLQVQSNHYRTFHLLIWLYFSAQSCLKLHADQNPQHNFN